MRYRHVVAFRVAGISASDVDIEIPVAAKGYTCILTKRPDSLLESSDRSTAVATLVLTALFSPDSRLGQSPDERILTAASEIRAERAKKYPSASYIILYGEDEIDFPIPTIAPETDTLIVCFDAVDKNKLSERLRPKVARSVTSLAVSFPYLVGLEPARNTIDLFRDDGKQLVSLTLSAGGALSVSTGVKEQHLEYAAKAATALGQEYDLERVDVHLTQSLVMQHDRMRAFLSAWTALECFVNKAFKQHCANYYDELKAGASETTILFLRRIIEVMKDKYRLSDKFALVAGRLDPSNCTADYKTFQRAKKLRDSFSHGEDVEVNALPVDDVLVLLRKYLALHIGISD